VRPQQRGPPAGPTQALREATVDVDALWHSFLPFFCFGLPPVRGRWR
jgi:hypothetical protein